MDNLPNHLIIEILSRLNNSTELVRCKLVSKTFNTLARQVRSIDLYCSLDRYNKMWWPEIRLKLTLFKSIMDKLISDAEAPIESVPLGVEIPFCDDWMTKIGHGLKSILIVPCPQLHCKKIVTLEVISHHCHSLVELKLENAYVSVDDMHVMPLLTRLMLRNVTNLDRHLSKLMECLPCLQVLNIDDDRGDTDINIHHLNLKELKWTRLEYEQNDVLSSMTIFAPNLTKLELECLDPTALSIHAPLLSYFHLALDCEGQYIKFDANKYDVVGFESLKTLRLVSSQLNYLFIAFPSSRTVENLTLDSPIDWAHIKRFKFSLLNVFNVFPNVTSLTLGSEVWSQQMVYPLAPLAHMKGLKQITLYLVSGNIDKALFFIIYVVGICTHLSDIVLFIHHDVDLSVAMSFVSSCTSQCPCQGVRWRIWGKKLPLHLKFHRVLQMLYEVLRYTSEIQW